MYLKEIGFISQSVMSDIQSIQVCSGLEQNRRHFLRSPCNSGYSQSRSDFPSQMEISIPGISQCRDNRQETLSFSKISGLHHRFSNVIHIRRITIRNGLYDPKVLSRLTRIVSEIFKNIRILGFQLSHNLNPNFSFQMV